jgi:hypothetical protein
VWKIGDEAVQGLEAVVKQYPGAPWEWFAKRDLAAPRGLMWKAAKVGE